MSKAAKPPKDKAAAAPGKGGSKKKLIILVAAVLLLGGGGAGAWFSGVLPKMLGKGGEDASHAADEHGAAKPAAGHAAAPAHGAPPASAHGAPAASAHGAPSGGAHGAAKPEAKAEKSDKGGPMFMDLPDIVANLNTGPRRATYVKLRAKLELSRPEDQAAIQAAMPKVLDLFQGYLREMRPEELRGSAGTYRLREELLARTNLAAPPARVVAVLFTEMIVQ